MHHTKNMNPHMKNCIELCNECSDECETIFYQHCLDMGGKHVEKEHAKLMADCVEICRTAARFMLRDSSQHAEICGVCAEVCDACADSCEDIGGEEMENCAETCRRCAEACRDMSKETITGRGTKQAAESAGQAI